MQTSIDKTTQKKILRAIDGLPPMAWLEVCQSQAQLEHWNLIRRAFQFTYVGLKEYFEGQKSTLDSELAIAQRNYYLAIYEVIQLGWHHIEIAAQDATLQDFPNTPGEAIVKLIENDCAAFFNPCLQYHEFSKDGAYRLYLLEKQVRELESKESLKSAEQRKIEKFSTKLKQMQRSYRELLNLRHFCLAVCRDVAKRDRTLKESLTIFNTRQLYLHSLIAPKLRKGESYCWDGRGNKKDGTRPGGAYS
jgi:flavin-binding protein dodecin